MDALSILALGVAQAGGGGGGGTSDYSDLSNKPQINNVTLSGNKSLSDLGIPTYTAGDNVTISNNEISVDGLVLEKEDRFVQDAVDKAEVSGENVFLSQNVNGHYSKSLLLDPSGVINGDDQTASKMFGLSPSRLWFEDYNLDRTVRLEPTSDYRNLAINGVPIGGGSSSGAVRYDEAQSLTYEQKNQAKANQELPYTSLVKTEVLTNYNRYNIPTAAQQINYYPTFHNMPSSFVVGSKVYLTITNSSASFEETAEGTFINATGTFRLNYPSDAKFFDTTTNTSGYISSSRLQFYKLDTSSLGLGGTSYISVSVDAPAYNNLLSENLVDSLILRKIKTTASEYGDISTDTGCYSGAGKEDGVVKPSLMSVSFGKSASQSPPVSQYGVSLGWDNRRGSNTRPMTQIGYNNDTAVQGGICIGNGLHTQTAYGGSDNTITINNNAPTLETVTSSTIVLGQYNDYNAMKVAQADLPVKWN